VDAGRHGRTALTPRKHNALPAATASRPPGRPRTLSPVTSRSTDGDLGRAGLIVTGSVDASLKIWDYQGKVMLEPTVRWLWLNCIIMG
jgi:hypothetical protein